jgi:hypothetical protein
MTGDADYLAGLFQQQQLVSNDQRVAASATVTRKDDSINGSVTIDSFDGGVHEFAVETGANAGDTVAVVKDENDKLWAISPIGTTGGNTDGGSPGSVYGGMSLIDGGGV